MLEIGSYFGNFWLKKRLREYGNRQVIEAVSLPQGLVVILHARKLDEQLSEEKLLKPIKKVALVNHLGLVRICDYGVLILNQQRWLYYTVLMSDCGELRLAFDELDNEIRIARFALRLAEALDALHLHGLVYQDLRPEQIVLDQAGQPMLLPAEHLLESSVSSAKSGADPYCSPEQTEGKKVDKRSDLYSLGMLLKRLVQNLNRVQSGKEASDSKKKMVQSRMQVRIHRRWTFIDRYMLAYNKRDRAKSASFIVRKLHEILDELRPSSGFSRAPVKNALTTPSKRWFSILKERRILISLSVMVVMFAVLMIPITIQGCRNLSLLNWFEDRPAMFKLLAMTQGTPISCLFLATKETMKQGEQLIANQHFKHAALWHARFVPMVETLDIPVLTKRFNEFRDKLINRVAIKDCEECPEMVLIPAGSFMRGTQHKPKVQQPRSKVRIDQPFFIGRYEISFEQWKACVSQGGCKESAGLLPWQVGDRPVTEVDYKAVNQYLKWLNDRTTHAYYLPSESQWAYAARADGTKRYPWGDDLQDSNGSVLLGSVRANCAVCGSQWDNKKAAPIGSFDANKMGLFDVYGNVWEMTADCWKDSYKGVPVDGSAYNNSQSCDLMTIRGGSWFHNNLDMARMIDLFTRRFVPIEKSYDNVGFRVARPIGLNP